MLEVEYRSIDALLPAARNPRTHSEVQIAQIAASIAERGFGNACLVGGDGLLIAGHGRLAAARKLGLGSVPVAVHNDLSPTQRRALLIADNRIAENASWDDAMLRVELDALREDDFDLTLTGFDADALAELMAGDEADGQGQTGADAVPTRRRSRARAMSGCAMGTACCAGMRPTRRSIRRCWVTRGRRWSGRTRAARALRRLRTAGRS